MKKIIIILIVIPFITNAQQQKGTLFLKGGEQIAFEKIKKAEKETVFYYVDS
jgi:hypothetical protein